MDLRNSMTWTTVHDPLNLESDARGRTNCPRAAPIHISLFVLSIGYVSHHLNVIWVDSNDSQHFFKARLTEGVTGV